MASDQNRVELDARARQGDTVIPGGTGGKTLKAQKHLAEENVCMINPSSRIRAGESSLTRREQLGRELYQEMGKKLGSAPLTSLARACNSARDPD